MVRIHYLGPNGFYSFGGLGRDHLIHRLPELIDSLRRPLYGLRGQVVRQGYYGESGKCTSAFHHLMFYPRARPYGEFEPGISRWLLLRLCRPGISQANHPQDLFALAVHDFLNQTDRAACS